MTPAARIYLDNAATSWPKPECVYEAVDHYLRHVGAAAGRGAYTESIEAGRLVDQARSRVARLLGAADASSIVFTLNGTDALNTILHGWLRPGDHVVTTQAEHNSVLRPLAELQRYAQLAQTIVPCNAAGWVDPQQVADALRPETRLVAVTHASNVTGTIEPVSEIVSLAHRQGVAVLVDAAQTAGYVPIDVAGWQIDFLVAPGHKGLLGPLGTGIAYIAPQHAAQVRSYRQGGTGTVSEQLQQPNSMPDKFEAGNLNVPGIVGLGAGVGWLTESGVAACRQRAEEQTAQLLTSLQGLEHVRLFGPADARRQVGVVSIEVPGVDVHELAALVESTFGIQVRAGLHCAPLIHQALGAAGGTLRMSQGHFTTDEQVAAAVEALTVAAAMLDVS
jgi:cysteine desulfurase/selenocysteine lyase